MAKEVYEVRGDLVYDNSAAIILSIPTYFPVHCYDTDNACIFIFTYVMLKCKSKHWSKW